MKEITYEELRLLPKDSYQLIDIRDDELTSGGIIPGAMIISVSDIEKGETITGIPSEKKLVFYCQVGRQTQEIDETADVLKGRECLSLTKGYVGYVIACVKSDLDKEERRNKAEDSIRKKFHKQLFSPFAKGCKKYRLIEEGDHIAVCISGGKDSMLMAKLFQELLRHGKRNFEAVFLVMNPGYNELNYSAVVENAKLLGIPIEVFRTEIFDIVAEQSDSPCYLCARMRRGSLYSKAKDLGCNKIALGHHYDDVIETILMGMLYGAQIQTMMPKLHSTNFDGMELIRPMYLIREKDIIRWRDYNDLHFIQCACRLTESCASCGGTEQGSKRGAVKDLIRTLTAQNPQIEKNIFRSVENVNLDTVIAYKQGRTRHHFLDSYV